MKILVVYYSMYGHVYALAKAVAEGAASVDGAGVALRRVPETLPPDILEAMGALQALEIQKDVPVCSVDELAESDAILFCTPTRFGNMCGQMRQFLDATGSLLARGGLGRQGRPRFHIHKHAARRAGIDNFKLYAHPAAPGHGRSRSALRFQGSVACR